MALLLASLVWTAVPPARATTTTLLGWIDSPHHVPMVGHEAFNRNRRGSANQPQLCLPLELHGLGGSGGGDPASTANGNGNGRSPRRPLALLQTRAPLLRGHAAAFAQELATWVAAQDIGRVVVVAGAAPSADEAVLDPGSRLWFHAMPVANGKLTPEQAGDVEAWAGRFHAQDLATAQPALYGDGNGVHVHVPHTGIAAPLLAACARAGIPSAGLFYFAAEGANDADAARLAHVLLEALLPPPAPRGGEENVGNGQAKAPLPLVAPRSWELLFGRSRRREMEAF